MIWTVNHHHNHHFLINCFHFIYYYYYDSNLFNRFLLYSNPIQFQNSLRLNWKIFYCRQRERVISSACDVCIRVCFCADDERERAVELKEKKEEIWFHFLQVPSNSNSYHFVLWLFHSFYFTPFFLLHWLLQLKSRR